jgi:hypothetical protein
MVGTRFLRLREGSGSCELRWTSCGSNSQTTRCAESPVSRELLAGSEIGYMML